MRLWTLLVNLPQSNSSEVIVSDIRSTKGSLGIVSVWSTAEPNLGIVSACMPTMKPLLRRIVPQAKLSNAKAKPSGSGSSGSDSFGFFKRARSNQQFRSLGEETSLEHLPPGAAGTGLQTYISSTRVDEGREEEGKLPVNAIGVKTNMGWQQSPREDPPR